MVRHATFNTDPVEIEKPIEVQTEDVDAEKQSPLHPIGTRTTEGGDTEKGSTRYAESESGLLYKKEHKKAERKLLMKLDVAILPFAVLLYLSAYLDRGNLANARLQGLQEELLDGEDRNYSIALCCFFVTYIVFSVPGTLLAKQFLPSRSIACAAAFNKAGLYVCRLFVGVGESMFGQAMALHFSFWYTKSDLAKRVGLFISAGAVSGAFGGLISFGVSSIKNSPIEQWRILFLIEGCPSILLAICVFFFMPSKPEKSKYLNEEQRTLCLTRLNQENNVESELGVDWGGVKRCLTDWKTYVISITYSCMNLTLGSVSGFLPTIIKGFGNFPSSSLQLINTHIFSLGYSNARAQLFTVPPYAVALVFMLILTSFSDWRQTRGLPAASVFCLGIIGWAILLAVPADEHYSARYFACICVVTAGYTNIPLIMSWQSGCTANQSQRATSLGMLNTLGQCLSLAAAFLFPSAEGPQYTKGASINLAFQGLGLILTLFMTSYYRWENRRRDMREGGKPAVGAHIDVKQGYDKAVGFRYVP
ncbi:high-affinity nicotinic acid transporter [Cryptococcus neoformans C23]|nr:high-affinity nicotinic acid transporter [Cryptococcus neoformans var. grubii C23]OXC81393.1 high-affinity nicotinic acid transporter [Cryptococcus neoformans var. grubii AD1-7a]OXH23240.1 high-affinity nicotinic acid transporter [Cryptococcus neoformans var. grubii]